MSNRHWEDISQERVRRYILPSGGMIEFNNPTKVGIKRTRLEDGGYFDSHVVECADGNGGYVVGFSAITWEGAPGHNANDSEFGERVNENV